MGRSTPSSTPVGGVPRARLRIPGLELLVEGLARRLREHHDQPGSVAGMLLAQGDPTGLSSPLGQLAVLGVLVSALAVLLRWWWYNRRR